MIQGRDLSFSMKDARARTLTRRGSRVGRSGCFTMSRSTLYQPTAAREPPMPEDAVVPIDWSALRSSGFYERCGKRWLALLLLAGLSPFIASLLALVALINLLQFRSVRRVLFVQVRVGRDGRPFRMFKFRTMRDATTTAFGSWSSGADQARVTRIGRILRKTHLDELPQVVNVIRGDMCLIGPRPELPEIEAWASRHVPAFSHRLALRPGITGLAQVAQGYTAQDIEQYRHKAELNERYRRELSLRLDIIVLVRTAMWMLCCRGWQWTPAGACAAAPSGSVATPAVKQVSNE